MATLFARIRGLVVAQAHEAVDRVEDPQAMSHQLVRELTVELAAANRGLVAALGAERQLQRSRERMGQEAADWERTAETLLRKGEEAMTREALERAVTLRQGAAALAQPLQRAARTVERLRGQVGRLRAELGRVRQRVAVIDVHQAAARALRSAGAADDACSRALDRAQELERHERKAEVADCEAEAAGELLDEQDRLERSVARINADGAVDEAMAALRSKLAAQAAAGPATGHPGSTEKSS
ncbi:MAG TPA: PspA/IM30 family protein [Nevskia sp.]|nr:PspA/IM30 family protein [Nevskia sp.]